MSVSEVVSLLCAVLSLIASIVIGIFQIVQNVRSNRIVKQQSERDFEINVEAVDLAARKFLLDNHDDCRFIPLCAIANAYNENRVYHRKIYNDFRLLPRAVQLKVFERCGWQMCDVEVDDFFGDCLELFRQSACVIGNEIGFRRMFYDRGKYVERAILYYGDELLPHPEYEYFNALTDILCVPFRDSRCDVPIITQAFERFGFQNVSELECCELACLIMGCVASSVGDRSIHALPDYETLSFSDEDYLNFDGLQTMEDLFLYTLFRVWSSLWDVTEFGYRLDLEKWLVKN